jgi:hypothetical protein
VVARLAAAGVFGTGTGWPDVVVAAIMAGLALQGAAIVISQSLGEWRQYPIVERAQLRINPRLAWLAKLYARKYR